MSDRCSVYVTCRVRNAGRICSAMGLQEGDTVPSTTGVPLVQCADEETSACVEDQAPRNIPHLGSHGEGYEYPPGRWACDGKRWVYVTTNVNDDCPVVRVGPNGVPDPAELATVRLFWEVYQKVCESFGIEPESAKLAS